MQGPRWALGLAAAACVLLLAPLAGASNSVAFADSVGDSPPAAPDLGAVRVSNDDAGQVVFRVSLSNRTALSPTDLVAVFVDGDARIATGCAPGVLGAEYALDVLADRYVFGRCVRGGWDFSGRPASFGGSFADSTLTLRVNRRDLGETGRFDFRIGAAATTSGSPAYDFAPDVGEVGWSYRVVAPPQAIFKPPTACRQHPRRCHRRR